LHSLALFVIILRSAYPAFPRNAADFDDSDVREKIFRWLTAGKEKQMQTRDFDYNLPKELIAQTPIADRSASRLLVYDRTTKIIEDRVFSDITRYLSPKDVLVRNNTRVLPARLFAHRLDTGGNMEFLLLKRTGEKTWECLARPARRAAGGR